MLTVGSIAAESKSNVIADRVVLQLNVRTYDDRTRSAILEAIERIVRSARPPTRWPCTGV